MGFRATAAILVVCASASACGEAPHSSNESPTTTSPTLATAGAPERTAPEPPRAADPSDDELQILIRQWRDPPEGVARWDLAPRIAALGTVGLERLIAAAAAESALDDLVGVVVAEIGDDALPVLARIAAEGSGAMRRIAVQAAPWDWPWLPAAPAFTKALLAALDDSDVEIRTAALHRLGGAAPSGVPVADALFVRIQAADASEADAAARALAELGASARPVISRLLDLVESDRGGPTERVAAIIEGVGPGNAADARRLVELLSDERFASAASSGLARAPELAAAHFDAVLARFATDDFGYIETNLLCEMLAVPGVAASVSVRLPSLPAAQAADLLEADGERFLDTSRTLLASPSAEIRLAAVRCLMQGERAADAAALRPLLDDSDTAVRAAAAEALFRDDASRDRAVAVARELLVGEAPPLSAVRVAASSHDPASNSALVALLVTVEPDVRAAIEEALSQESGRLGVPPPGVLQCLVDDALRVWSRDSAACVAVRFDGGAEALVAAASAVLGSPSDSKSAHRALRALARAGRPVSAATPEIERLLTSTADSYLRNAAVEALAALSDDVDVMAARVRGDAASARALLALGERGAAALVRGVGDCSGWVVDKLIADLGADARTPAVIAAIVSAAATTTDERGMVQARCGAARFASALGAERAVALCVPLLSDGARSVRSAAVEELSSLADAGADLAPAASALRTLLGGTEPSLRRDAILVARHVQSLAPDVRARLADEDSSVRLQAAAAVLADNPDDDVAGRALIEALGHATDRRQDLADADWGLVGDALATSSLDDRDVATLDRALRSLRYCGAQEHLLRALGRVGPGAAPAITSVRLALADRLPCRLGTHDDRPLTAGPALPDLRDLRVRGDDRLADEVRAAIEAIENPRR